MGLIYCDVCYLRWHGRKTDLAFLFYRRLRVAGHGVPGFISGQWIQTGWPSGKVLTIKDGSVCAAQDGDVFKLWISISFAHVQISYDNKTVIISGKRELGEIR